MAKITRMSESESVIMNIVWEQRAPMSPGEVLKNLSPEFNWKYKTVATFLTRLTAKGILDCKKQGNINTYTPKLSRQEYIEFETKQFLAQYHNGSVSNMIAALYKDDINKEKLDELFALIDKQDKGD